MGFASVEEEPSMAQTATFFPLSLQDLYSVVVVSTLCQEMKIQLTRKVGFEGTSKLDPC